MPVTLDSIKEKMVGSTFGKLTILEYAGRSKRGDNLWRCQCTCGSEVVGRTANVDKPTSACTGCKRKNGPRALQLRTYLLDKVFGRLSVIKYEGTDRYQFGQWRCRCECGNEIVTRSSNLITGTTQSCGCYARERTGKASFKHGLYKHPLHQVYFQMKERCYNSNSKSFSRYGLRGIRVCDEWLTGFMAFYEWAIANDYQPGLTINRKNNDGNYEPNNCEWATPEEQMQNTSLTKITIGQVRVIREDTRSNRAITKDHGVDESTISRIKSYRTWKNIT